MNEGKEVLPSSLFIIDGEHLKADKDFFPFSWSVNGKGEAIASPSLH